MAQDYTGFKFPDLDLVKSDKESNCPIIQYLPKIVLAFKEIEDIEKVRRLMSVFQRQS